MGEPYKGRYCSTFYCDKRRDRYCCRDCPKQEKLKAFIAVYSALKGE